MQLLGCDWGRRETTTLAWLLVAHLASRMASRPGGRANDRLDGSTMGKDGRLEPRPTIGKGSLFRARKLLAVGPLVAATTTATTTITTKACRPAEQTHFVSQRGMALGLHAVRCWSQGIDQ